MHIASPEVTMVNKTWFLPSKNSQSKGNITQIKTIPWDILKGESTRRDTNSDSFLHHPILSFKAEISVKEN